MKLSAADRETLRHAAAVVIAQEELVEAYKRRKQGRPMLANAGGPALGALLTAMILLYFSALAVTPARDTGGAPIFVSGDLETPPPLG
jgi:hypothetical protein